MLPPFSNPEHYDLPVRMPKQFRCQGCGEYHEHAVMAMSCCDAQNNCHAHESPEHQVPAKINLNYLECDVCGAACFKTSVEHLQELLEGYRG